MASRSQVPQHIFLDSIRLNYIINSMRRFRWNAWNLDHATRHGVAPEEAEGVVRRARPPYPQLQGDGKWLVVGRGLGGRWIQVAYVIEDDGQTTYVIHARPSTDREKWRHRRRTRLS